MEVSNNYAIHRSDCDTNTYLMIDAMRMKGIEGYIVYAPNHAFLAWKDSFGHFNYWETTDNNNTGKIASLNDKFYTKTFDKTYYTPMNARQAESVYNALIYKKSKEKVDISELYNKNKDNAIISDWYFYSLDELNEIKKSDAQIMLSLLHTDFTSSDKKMAILHYLIRNHRKEDALVMLDNISAIQCGMDCVTAGAELGRLSSIILRKPFSVYDNYLKTSGLRGNKEDFCIGFIFAAAALLLAIITPMLFIREYKKIK